MVQPGVELDSALGAAEAGPGEPRDTQLDDGGVQAVEFVVELELVLGRPRLTRPVHFLEEGLIKGGRAAVIRLGKSGAGHGFGAQVVKAGEPGLQTRHRIPQAEPGGQLHKHQLYELIPTGEGPGYGDQCRALPQVGKTNEPLAKLVFLSS